MKMKILGFLVCFLMLAIISISATQTTEIPEATKDEHEPSEMQVVTITRPVSGNLYLFDTIVIPIGGTNAIIIGSITLQASAQPNVAGVVWMVYDNNGNAWHQDIYPTVGPPNFQLFYNTAHGLLGIILAGGPQAVITANACDASGNPLGSATLNAIKIL